MFINHRVNRENTEDKHKNNHNTGMKPAGLINTVHLPTEASGNHKVDNECTMFTKKYK